MQATRTCPRCSRTAGPSGRPAAARGGETRAVGREQPGERRARARRPADGLTPTRRRSSPGHFGRGTGPHRATTGFRHAASRSARTSGSPATARSPCPAGVRSRCVDAATTSSASARSTPANRCCAGVRLSASANPRRSRASTGTPRRASQRIAPSRAWIAESSSAPDGPASGGPGILRCEFFAVVKADLRGAAQLTVRPFRRHPSLTSKVLHHV